MSFCFRSREEKLLDIRLPLSQKAVMLTLLCQASCSGGVYQQSKKDPDNTPKPLSLTVVQLLILLGPL